MFTPDKAFDRIVQEQVKMLRDPTNKCVELVVTEVLNIVQKCSEKVRRNLYWQEYFHRNIFVKKHQQVYLSVELCSIKKTLAFTR